jgi:hypothetical protein
MASLSLYVLTFNCGRELIDTSAFASQLFNGLDSPQLPDLLIISLQELAPLAYSYIGGSFLVPYFSRIQEAVGIAAKNLTGIETDRYGNPVAICNVGMTAIMAFAKDSAAIDGIETTGVGLGTWEMGSKGAVGLRLLYLDTELTFVAAHLAAMEENLERRNENWKNLVRGLVFPSSMQERKGNAASLSRTPREDEQGLLPISSQFTGIYRPTSHMFLAGDLNYRTSSLKPSPTDYLDSFPQPHHDEDSPQHHSNLFEYDQLTQEREAGRTCHGMIEAPVTFPPTYKYTSDEPFLVPDQDISQWNWARHRWPSWCDRILYLDVPAWLKRQAPGAQIVAHKYIALPLFPTSDHRAVALALTVPLIPIPSLDENEDGNDPRIKPPFDVNPYWRPERQRARALELIVGFGLYFTSTWEGRAVLVGTVAGIAGGYGVIRAVLDF